MQALLRKDGDSPVFLSCFFLPVARAVFCSFSATSPPAPSTFPTLHLFPEAKGAGEGGAGEREVICPSTSVEKRKTSSSPCERTQWCLFPSVDGSGSRNGWVTRYQKENLKRLRRMRENARGRLRDPEERWRLRMKFLTQAKSYIGTPYSRKYQEPGTVEYESPLFLDCCGLVRKAVRDLSEDFGFVIGPGNQAYQYDTLPLTLEKHEDMKPGDLVFISGTYFSPHMKRQIHDIVHVEIWLGDGEGTLGARWRRGTVQVFDSYKFTSSSYGHVKYHFKSIETWLSGSCISHCKDHKWGFPREMPCGKSIFYCEDMAKQEGAPQGPLSEPGHTEPQPVTASGGDRQHTAGEQECTGTGGPAVPPGTGSELPGGPSTPETGELPSGRQWSPRAHPPARSRPGARPSREVKRDVQLPQQQEEKQDGHRASRERPAVKEEGGPGVPAAGPAHAL